VVEVGEWQNAAAARTLIASAVAAAAAPKVHGEATAKRGAPIST
jgi:hypothetical protein